MALGKEKQVLSSPTALGAAGRFHFTVRKEIQESARDPPAAYG